MYVKRYQPRPSRSPMTAACGCLSLLAGGLVLAVLGFVLIVPALPTMLLRTLGALPLGETEALYMPLEAAPLPELTPGALPATLLLEIPDVPQQRLDPALLPGELLNGVAAGSAYLQATYSEEDLLALCGQYTDICGPGGRDLRNVTIDLKPGGAILYAELRLPDTNLWQSVGIPLRIVDRRRVEVLGIDMGGALYSLPPGTLEQMVSQATARANEALTQLVLRTGSTTFRLNAVYADDTTLTIIMR